MSRCDTTNRNRWSSVNDVTLSSRSVILFAVQRWPLDSVAFSEKVESVKHNRFIAVSHSTKTKTEENVSPLTSDQRVEADSERLTEVRGHHDLLVSMETELSCLRCCFHRFQPVVAFTSEHIQKKNFIGRNIVTAYVKKNAETEPHKSTESSWLLQPRWDGPLTQRRATLATSWMLSSAKRAETKNFPHLTNVNKVNSQWRTKVTTGWEDRELEGRVINKTQFLLPVGGVLSKTTSTQKHWNITLYCYTSFTCRLFFSAQSYKLAAVWPSVVRTVFEHQCNDVWCNIHS